MKDGDGVRGVVPQRIKRCTKTKKQTSSVRLMFRPDRVYQNATVQVLDGDILTCGR